MDEQRQSLNRNLGLGAKGQVAMASVWMDEWMDGQIDRYMNSHY